MAPTRMTCRAPLQLQNAPEQPPTDRILDQLYGLSETERRVFVALLERSEPAEVDDLADRLDRSRTTVYRALSRLVDANLAIQRHHCFADGGYCHRYRVPAVERLVSSFYRRLNDRFDRLATQVDVFAAGECLSVSDH